MTVDTEGRIYLASRKPSRPGILVIDPTGKEVAFIKTGEPQQGAREPVGNPEQRRLRHRRREERALHHRGQEPLPDPAERDRLPHPLGQVRPMAREFETWIP